VVGKFAPAYACFFDRKPAAPALGLQMRLAGPRLNVLQDVNWRVGLGQADFRAALRLTAPDADLGMVEWDVPEGVAVSRVSGPEVRSWSRTGSHVQVWWMRSVAQTEIHLSGWWRPARPPSPRDNEFVWELPRFGTPSAEEQTTLLRLTASTGLA